MTQPTPPPPRPIMPGTGRRGPRTVVRILLILAASLVVLVVSASVLLYFQLKRSLPLLEGEHSLAGLSSGVTVDRDELGIPTIRGTSREDVARATGFVHAQDRAFQMDLLRRRAAGELSGLIGAAALRADRPVRRHRFRHRAREAFEALTSYQKGILGAYAEGVNAGVAALAAPPFEYMVLRAEPEPWMPEDTLLVIYTMYLDLQGDEGRRESNIGLMKELLPGPLFDFLAPRGTEWDAPVTGEPFDGPGMPGPEVYDARRGEGVEEDPGAEQPGPAGDATDDAKGPGPPGGLRASGIAALADLQAWSWMESVAGEPMPGPEDPRGSNNWVVGPGHTGHGGAILANDPHLGLAVPNIWYRMSLIYPGEDGSDLRVTGVSLPGTPSVVIGSNGHVAWGFTNSHGDWSDLVVLEPGPEGDGTYMTPDGPREIETVTELIPVKDSPGELIEIPETIWGPVIDEDHRGRKRALRWAAHDPAGVNFGFLSMETLRSVDQALAIAGETGLPAQNFVVADADGSIAWTILGPVPRRFGHDGRVPMSWAGGERGWDGYLASEEYPRIVDPGGGRIWTANNRVVGGDDYEVLGDGGLALGARARQIRDGLRAMDVATEVLMLELQLDDRALFLQRWQEFLVETLGDSALNGHPQRAEMRRLAEAWGGRATVDSAGYRLVRAFRWEVRDQVYGYLTGACKKADDRFDHRWLSQQEGPLWTMVTERPLHLLDPSFESWDDQLLAAVDGVLSKMQEIGPNLSERTWGERNTSRFRHPLSPFLPGSSRLLDMPPTPLPGDRDMPRVQSPSFGASMRMSVSPGREAEGILMMPGGQSGHPLSPHYRAGHDIWVNGDPYLFLPGLPAHTLNLTP